MGEPRTDAGGALRGRRVLVTGAAGFIGANLVKALLRAPAEVHALVGPGTSLWRITGDLPAITLHYCNLLDRERLDAVVRQAMPDVIFHLAMRGGHPSTPPERLDMLLAAAAGTANLLEATAPLDYSRFIHAGSSLEYGPKTVPMREDDRLEPVTFRGAAKAAASLLCLQHAHARRRPIAVLRFFSVYGFWEQPSRLVPTIVRAALRAEEVTLTEPGYRRDFVFVEDAVDGLLRTADAPGVIGEVVNIGSGRQWRNEDVVRTVETLTGTHLRARVGVHSARPSDTAHWVADIGKAERVLGWRPRHDLERGLARTIEWFRTHLELYERTTAAAG